jgi:hypothetical protein
VGEYIEMSAFHEKTETISTVQLLAVYICQVRSVMEGGINPADVENEAPF